MTIRRLALLAALAAIAAFVAIAVFAHQGAPALGSVVFVQVPVGDGRGEVRGSVGWPWLLPAGGRILLIDRSEGAARTKALTRSFSSACDPSVAADGRRLVFAGRKREGDRWQIWEMAAGGGRARRVVGFPGDCASPVWLPDNGAPSSPRYVPDGRVLFAGSGVPRGSPSGDGAWQLYSCKRNGTGLVRLTYGTSSTYDPTVLADGRVVYATRHWRQEGPADPLLGAVWYMRQDGTGPGALCPGAEGGLKHSPVQVGGRLLFVATHESDAFGGQLASIALNRPFSTFAKLTKALHGQFQSACPLSEGRLVVSYRPPEEDATFGLYEFDLVARQLGRVVYDDPDYDEIDPAVVRTRAPAHGHVSVVIPGKTTAELYCLNVYESQLPGVRELAPDGIKRVRVYETGRRRAGPPPEVRENPSAAEPLGEAPVEADGSFFIEVPADRPLQWELVDEEGDAVARTPVSLWARPFEHRGCVGCHASHRRAADNFIPKAVERRASPVGIERKTRIVGFREAIMPIIEERCAKCHGPGGPTTPRLTAQPARTPSGAGVNEAYAGLVHTTDPVTELPRWIYPGSSRTSPLPMVMSVHTRADRVELSEEEGLMLMKWIDSGASWDAAGSYLPPKAADLASYGMEGR